MNRQLLMPPVQEDRGILQCHSLNNLLSPTKKEEFLLRRIKAVHLVSLNLPYTKSKKKLLVEHAIILLGFLSGRLDRSMTIPIHISEISEETKLAVSRIRTVFHFLEAVRILKYSKSIVSIYKISDLRSYTEH